MVQNWVANNENVYEEINASQEENGVVTIEKRGTGNKEKRYILKETGGFRLV